MLTRGFERVVHFEDDLQAALSIVAVDRQKVFVYLLDNLATRPWVLRRTGNEVLPPNIKIVSDLAKAHEDLQARLLNSPA